MPKFKSNFLNYLAPLAALQSIAQIFLLAAGATPEESLLSVCLATCLAPLFSRRAWFVYKQAYSLNLKS